MLPRNHFEKESDLAAVVIAHLKMMKWDVYQEVQLHTMSTVADIVAVQGRVSWIIECKLTQSLAVMEQAWRWHGCANYVSIAVPAGHKKGRDFADKILEGFGIGRMAVSVSGYDDNRVRESVRPRLNRKIYDPITKCLCEEHKSFAQAGSNEGSHWTPWQQTCRNIMLFVRDHPGCTLKELMGGIEHHYGTESTARSCIAKWGLAGSVHQVEFRREGKEITLHLINAPDSRKTL